MGYEGPSLAAAYDFGGSVDELLRDITSEAGDRMTAHIRELTPVGHQPFVAGYMPGHLRESISKKVVVVFMEAGGLVYESGTETNVDYSIYVEEGTGLWGPARAKYEIRPKNPNGWLRFYDHAGNAIFAKRVMHPGSPGAHMFTRGTALTEVEFSKWAGEKVRLWEERQDREIVLRGNARRIAS